MTGNIDLTNIDLIDIIEHTMEGVVAADLDGKIVYANSRVAELYGMTVEEMLGKPLDKLFAAEVARESYGRLGQHVGGESAQYEMHLAFPSGLELEVMVSAGPLRDLSGNIVGAIAHVRDNTDVQRAEHELRTAHERLERMFDFTGAAFFECASDGTILSCNSKFVDLFGFSSIANALGSNTRALFFSDADFQLADGTVYANGSMRQLEFRLRCRTGEPIEVIASAFREKTPQGTRIMGFLLNVSELRRSERIALLGRVTSILTHEFNNVLMGMTPWAEVIVRMLRKDPLRGGLLTTLEGAFSKVRMYASGLKEHCAENKEYAALVQSLQACLEQLELLRMSERDVGKMEKAIATIQSAIDRGRRITDEVRRFSTPAQLEVVTYEFGTWLHNITAELSETYKARVHVSVEALEEPLWVCADRQQLTQVIQNLVSNAADAALISTGIVRVVASVDDTHVMLSVEDNGRGIAPSDIAMIFEPFFTRKPTKGTGLGLAVCQEILIRHGSRITVVSEPGKGARFSFTLPLVPEPEHMEAEVDLADIQVPGATVLIVDDEVMIAQGQTEMLARHGFVASCVHSLAEAADSLERTLPDAVVLDLKLPDGDGKTFYTDVIQPRWPELPVVFSTAHAERAMMGGLLDLPTVAFLQKPYETAKLVEALGYLLHSIESL